MNGLSEFLVEGILNEVTEKVVALFGGGFKPPTKGHLEVVNQGLQQSPEVTEVKILVGGGERDGFTQRQAVKIWNLYNDIGFISKPATVIPVSSPFKYYKEYLQNNPEDKVYVFIGSRPGDDKD
jgi:nicotinic acid mononucleotide adenylyltransferase